MTEPTCASAGTKTNRIRVVGSNFGSAARVTTTYWSTYNGNIIPVHNLIMLFILQKKRREDEQDEDKQIKQSNKNPNSENL